METIRNAALVSVGRACGFAGLAIFVLIFALSFEPVMAARVGALLCLGVTLFLSFCALRARRRPYKRTEVWIILPKEERPPAVVAQRVIGEVLRETYFWFAQQTGFAAFVFLVASVGLKLAGVERPWG